jgi:hypothetical protein
VSDYIAGVYPGSVDNIAEDEYQNPSIWQYDKPYSTNPFIYLRDGWTGIGSLGEIAFTSGGSIVDNGTNLLITNLEVVGLDYTTLTGTTIVASDITASSADITTLEVSSLTVTAQENVDRTYILAGTHTSVINDLFDVIGSGTVNLMGGRYIVDEAIIGRDNISIYGVGYPTEFYMTSNCSLVSGAGSSGSEITNMQFKNFSVTQDSDDTNENDVFSFDYCDNYLIENVTAHDCRKQFFRGSNCDYGKIINNSFYEMHGFPSTEADLISCIDIGSGCTNTKVSDNLGYNNGNLIVRGNCESNVAPMIQGEVTPDSGNSSWARSDEQAYRGTYSYKLSVTSGGTTAYVRLTDSQSSSDMHGLVAGKTYNLKCRIYIPSSGGPSYSEVRVSWAEYAGSWSYNNTYCQNIVDSFQEMDIEFTLDESATGAHLYFSIDSTASSSEYVYVDQIKLIPIGIHNQHEQQYIDLGEGTSV